MKRSLIIGVFIVAIFTLTSFSIPDNDDSGLNVSAKEKEEYVLEELHSIQYSSNNTTTTLEPPKVKENVEADCGIEEVEEMYYTEEEVVMMAKLLFRECGGIPSDTEKACVAWTVCNRADKEEFAGDTIADVMTYPGAFAYIENTPVDEHLYWLASDVLSRWNSERNGEPSVGRVLPPDYTYFSGDGKHNYFRNAYSGDYDIWDYSLQSPYES